MNRIIIKIKLFAIGFLMMGGLIAQQKLTKVSQAIKVDKDVTIDLSTSYCNIVFDTWNKDTIEIEAYIEGEGLNKEALQNALNSWDVDVDASRGLVTIKAKGSGSDIWFSNSNDWVHNHGHEDNAAVNAVLEELKFELADLPEIHFDHDLDIEVPEIPELPEMPEMPELPELPKGIHNFHFDYEAYKKDGENYLEAYTEKFESEYGEDYAKKMEAWTEKYRKQIKALAKKFDGEWEEKYGEQMEAWRERFEMQMERQAKRSEAQAERMEAIHKKREETLEKRVEQRKKHAKEREKLAGERRVLIKKMVNGESRSKVKKTIKIRMPKKAKLKVNVRHGEIEFAANVDDLKADLSHTKFTAHSIDGSFTSVNASYSPVYVNYWNLGELNLRYTENVELAQVNHMVLNSSSSNTTIKHLLGSALIDGNIGDLKILDIDDAFSNLNIIIQNSNADISLPKVAHNLQYNGNHTRFKHPKKTTGNISTFSTGNLSSGKNIVINAKYSNVTMK